MLPSTSQVTTSWEKEINWQYEQQWPFSNIIIPPLHHFTILGQKNAKNMPRYYTVEQGKNRLKRSEKVAAQNEMNFALFTCKAQKFSMSSLVTFSILTNQINDTLIVLLVLLMSFARVLCNRYDARWISKTKSQNTRQWRSGGIINPLFNGLTYNTRGHYAHCSYFSEPRRSEEKYYATRKISAHIIC